MRVVETEVKAEWFNKGTTKNESSQEVTDNRLSYRRALYGEALLGHGSYASRYSLSVYGQQEHFEYIAMEILGPSVVERQKKNRLETEAQLAGLDHTHSLGIVHRDIKPENLLCSFDNSRIKIIAFGISKPFSHGPPTEPQLEIPGQDEGDDDLSENTYFGMDIETWDPRQGKQNKDLTLLTEQEAELDSRTPKIVEVNR
ncbi:hypothetical protein F5146DRAFT_1117656 [Armillaria mellea]|nr:hypothetical protein F5146DRAFT_1117656 [Armillaria mellea]